MHEELTYAAFLPTLGGRFIVRRDEQAALELELIEAAVLPKHAGAPRAEPFSLVFRGAMTSALSQRIHIIEHQTLGTFELFLVPIGPDDKGLCYEAVFN